MTKKSKKKTERLWVKSYHETMESPAWRAMSTGARMLYLELKKHYHRKNQEPVYLSTRLAAKALNADKETICVWYAELVHCGFLVRVKEARKGDLGGRAAHYRLTDEAYLGDPPTKDFTYWNGVEFDAYVRKIRTRCTENPYIRMYGKSVHPISPKPKNTGKQRISQKGGVRKTRTYLAI
jgi:predicted transcriptional regulator